MCILHGATAYPITSIQFLGDKIEDIPSVNFWVYGSRNQGLDVSFDASSGLFKYTTWSVWSPITC